MRSKRTAAFMAVACTLAACPSDPEHLTPEGFGRLAGSDGAGSWRGDLWAAGGADIAADALSTGSTTAGGQDSLTDAPAGDLAEPSDSGAPTTDVADTVDAAGEVEDAVDAADPPDAADVTDPLDAADALASEISLPDVADDLDGAVPGDLPDPVDAPVEADVGSAADSDGAVAADGGCVPAACGPECGGSLAGLVPGIPWETSGGASADGDTLELASIGPAGAAWAYLPAGASAGYFQLTIQMTVHGLDPGARFVALITEAEALPEAAPEGVGLAVGTDGLSAVRLGGDTVESSPAQPISTDASFAVTVTRTCTEVALTAGAGPVSPLPLCGVGPQRGLLVGLVGGGSVTVSGLSLATCPTPAAPKCDPATLETACPEEQPACWQAACNPLVGCQAAPSPEGAACDDGDPCSIGDVCDAGSCAPGDGAPDCDDGDPCTADDCQVGEGCVHPPGPTAACEDGDACTVNDTCVGGACQAGTDACTDGDLWVDAAAFGDPAADGSELHPFATLQEAFDVALSGATVRVLSGFYTAGAWIQVPDVTLQGEDAETTQVFATGDQALITVAADHVTVRSLTLGGARIGVHLAGTAESPITGGTVTDLRIQGLAASAEPGTGAWAAGVLVEHAHAVAVSAVTVSGVVGGLGANGTVGNPNGAGGVGAGVACVAASAFSVTGGLMSQISGGAGAGGKPGYRTGGPGGLAAGVYLDGCPGALVSDNVIAGIGGGPGGVGGNLGNVGTGGTGGLGAGIYLRGSPGASIERNAVSALTGGIAGQSAVDPTIPGNDQVGFGVYVEPDSVAVTIASTNTVDGDPVVFVHGATGGSLTGFELLQPSNPTNWGKIAVFASSGVAITGNTVRTFVGEAAESGRYTPNNHGAPPPAGLGAGVRVDGCESCVVEQNVVSDITGGAGAPGGTGSHGSSGGLAAAVHVRGCVGCTIRGNALHEVRGGKGGTGGRWSMKSSNQPAASGGTGGIGAGIYLAESTGSLVQTNTLTGIGGGSGGHSRNDEADGPEQVGFGVFLEPSGRDATITADNTAEGAPVLYLYGVDEGELSDQSFQATLNPTNLGLIAVVESTGVVVKNNTVSGFRGATGGSGYQPVGGPDGHAGAGIHFDGCVDCTASLNVVSGVVGGTGGTGHSEGPGGAGGLAAGISIRSSTVTVDGNTVTGMTGGTGGNGGSWGVGGVGGVGAGIALEATTGSTLLGNTLSDLAGGPGGACGWGDGPDQTAFGVYLFPDALDNAVLESNQYGGEQVFYRYGASPETLSNLLLTAPVNPTNWGKIAVIASSGVVVEDVVLQGFTGQAGCADCVAAGLRLEGGAGCRARRVRISGVRGGAGVGDIASGDAAGVLVASMLGGQVDRIVISDVAGSPGSDASGRAYGVLVSEASGVSLFGVTAYAIGAGGRPGHGIGLAPLQAAPVSVHGLVVSTTTDACFWSDPKNGASLLSIAYSIGHACGAPTPGNVQVLGTVSDGDPLFVNASMGDLRLLPGSPGTDAGSPTAPYAAEPAPNGCRRNMGGYGDTSQAVADADASHCP